MASPNVVQPPGDVLVELQQARLELADLRGVRRRNHELRDQLDALTRRMGDCRVGRPYYQHYEGQIVRVELFPVQHSVSGDRFVVYRGVLSFDRNGPVLEEGGQAHPFKQFFSDVIVGSKIVERFTQITEDQARRTLLPPAETASKGDVDALKPAGVLHHGAARCITGNEATAK